MQFLKLLNLCITSPASPVKAPSTDAVDLDVCNNVLIKNCYMSVNDDAVALKGEKDLGQIKMPIMEKTMILLLKTVPTDSVIVPLLVVVSLSLAGM